MARTTEDSEELQEKTIDKNIEDGSETEVEEKQESEAKAAGEEKAGGEAQAEEAGKPESGAEGADSEQPEAADAEKQAGEAQPDSEVEPVSEPQAAGEEEPVSEAQAAGAEETVNEAQAAGAEEPESEPESDSGPKEVKGEERQEKAAPKTRKRRRQAEKQEKAAAKKAKKTAYDDPEDEESEEEGGMGLNLFTLFVLLIAAAITIVYYTCTVKTVKVTGNHLYTSEEIAAMVISDDTQLRHNTVFLTALYMTPKAPRIPFEESVSVSLESYDTIKIAVKDMDIAAFIPYAGKYLYFSADGIVLENSPLLVKNATFVTGLNITGAERGMKMTSDDEGGLSMVLEVLQILRKYQIEAESVVLAESGGVVMYMDDIKVMLGRSGYELKISKIAQLLPYLEGRSGVIDLTNYTSADQNIILK